MRRRDFIAGLAAAWPLVARGQGSTKVPRLGVLWPNPLTTFEFLRQGLLEHGYVDGQNIKFELRVSPAPTERLVEIARELVAIPVDVLVISVPQATMAARKATRTIPIVFVAIGDPIASGLVPSIAHPGANLTGTTRMLSEMSAKHVELIKEAVPSLTTLAVLWNPTNTSHGPALEAAQATARSLSLQVRQIEVRAESELDSTFSLLSGERNDGVLFIADPVFFLALKRMADYFASNRLPAIANFRISQARRSDGLCSKHSR